MSRSGLLAQLPSMGDLESVRSLVEGGLGSALAGAKGDPARWLGALPQLLAALDDESPDLSELIEPLEGLVSQLSDALPSGLPQQAAAALPLMRQVADAAQGDGLNTLLDRLRNGISASDVALDAVRSLATQLLAELPVGAGGAAPADLQAALATFTQAARALGPSPDPAALSRFLADHVLGLPLGPLGGAASVRENLLAALDGVAAAAGGNLQATGEAAAARLEDAAARLEALDPTQAVQWQQARAVLAAAAEAMNTYRAALQRIPPAVSAGLDAINLDRYKAQLRQALAALPVEAGIPNLGMYSSLDSLVDAALQPVDRTAEALAAFSADAIVGRLQETLQRIETLIDSLLATVQDNPLLDRLNRAAQALATAIAAVQNGVQRALDGLLATVDQALVQFNAVKAQVEAALAALQQAVSALDAAALAQGIRDAFDQFNGVLAAIPLDQLKGQLDEALSTVEQLVGTLNETTGEAVAQVDRLAASLDEIQFGPLVDPVIGGINTVRDVLAAIDPSLLPDSVKDELAPAIDAFKAPLGSNPAGWFDPKVRDPLNSAFDAAVSAVRDTVAKLQRKLRQFAQEIDKLNPAELLAPLTQVFAQLDAAVTRLNPDALLAKPRALLEKAVQTLQQHPPTALFAPIEQAFEQDVLEPANRIRPSELLQPAIDAFAPVQEAIQKLDFSDLAAGLPAPTLPDLAALVGAWDDALAAALASLDPGQLLEPVRAALAPVADTVAAAADDALMAVGAQIKRLASLGDLFDTDVLTAAITGPLDRAATAIEQGPSQVAALVRPVYQRLLTALAQVDRAVLPGPLVQEYDAVVAAVRALDPDVALAETGATLAAVALRVRQAAARSANLTDLRGAFGAAVAQIAGRLPGFLGGELSPTGIRQGLAAVGPEAVLEKVRQRAQALVDAAQHLRAAVSEALTAFATALNQKLAMLDPAALGQRLDKMFRPVREALASAHPGVIAQALDQAFAQLLERLGQVHPKVIREPVQQLFETVLAKLIEVKDQLLGALAEAINGALAAIREKLCSLDPQALVVGLGNLFALIRQTLEALDLAGLLDRLTAAFDRLRTDLNTALQKSLDAFTQMVKAIPVLKVEAIPV